MTYIATVEFKVKASLLGKFGPVTIVLEKEKK
jgi:hypothetical protein